MRVLVVEPMKEPYEKDIPEGLSAMQELVGGYIEAVYPFEDNVALVCNEMGKLNNLMPNRLLKDERGEAYDVVHGTFFIAGLGEEDFKSLTDEQIKTYKTMYSKEMLFPSKRESEKTNGKDTKKHER